MGGIPDQMAGVPECGTVRRTDEVVGEEAVYLFYGRDHGLLSCSFITGIGGGSVLLCVVLPYDPGDHRADVDLGGSGVRLAVIGVHHLHGERDTALLYGDRGRISVQDLSGDEAQADLYPERFQ